MPIEQLVILALVQGITEFLPISSSGHLILVPHLTGEADQGPIIDVAVHVGTLGAVMLYLWRDIARMLLGLGMTVRGRVDPGARLAFQLIVATLPLVAAGYAASRWLTVDLRSIEVIGWATLGFGILLWVVDRAGLTIRKIEHLGYGGALFIGVSQVLALIPGTSRSGITMTAARMLGFERSEAARFSMLLAIPAIIAAGTLAGLDLYEAGDSRVTADALIAGGLALVTALIAIVAMMGWLRRASFTPFVIYRVGLGLGLLTWHYFG